MRLIHKNPRELATCIKDLIDSYLDELMEYDVLQERLKKLVEANPDRVYKDGIISLKIANVIGSSRVEIIDKIIKE